jgi:hypothetical protein
MKLVDLLTIASIHALVWSTVENVLVILGSDQLKLCRGFRNRTHRFFSIESHEFMVSGSPPLSPERGRRSRRSVTISGLISSSC